MKRGFTLIELLVVIAIIGLLSSVILSSLGAARTKANDTKRRSDLHQLQNALEFYFTNNNTYPVGTFFSVWDGSTNNKLGCWNGGTSGGFCPLVTGGTIGGLPHDPNNIEAGAGNYLLDTPPTDRGYVYWSNGQEYILGTNLESGGGAASRCGNFQVAVSNTACPI